MDIIKLYGAGIETFIPDEKMGHDFYKIANQIIQNPHETLILTIDADDICQPCQFCKKGICDDGLSSIEGFSQKDQYNKNLDTRILDFYKLISSYQAYDLCQIFYNHKEFIFDVWQEEDNNLTNRRYELFCKGAQKYLSHK